MNLEWKKDFECLDNADSLSPDLQVISYDISTNAATNRARLEMRQAIKKPSKDDLWNENV